MLDPSLTSPLGRNGKNIGPAPRPTTGADEHLPGKLCKRWAAVGAYLGAHLDSYTVPNHAPKPPVHAVVDVMAPDPADAPTRRPPTIRGMALFGRSREDREQASSNGHQAADPSIDEPVVSIDEPVVDLVERPTRAGEMADTHPVPGRLGDLLVQRRLITPSQLREALLQQSGGVGGERVGTILVRAGVLDERTLTNSLAAQLGLVTIDLRTERPEPDAIAALPESVARDLMAIPIARIAGRLVIAVGDPGVPGLLEQLRAAVGEDVDLAIAPPSFVRPVVRDGQRPRPATAVATA